MITMNGLGAGGDNCDPATSWYQSDPNMAYYGSCIPFAGLPGSSSTGPAPTTQTTAASPWWGSLLTSLTSGVVKGIVGDDGKPVPTAPTFPMPAPTPWYATPTGMIGIGVGAVALIFLLRK